MTGVPGRFPFPPPTSISAEAAAALEVMAARAQFPPYPAVDDTAGWAAFIAERDAEIAARFRGGGHLPPGMQVERRALGGVDVFDITPAGVAADSGKVVLDLHGGGFTYLGGDGCRLTGMASATTTGVRTLSVDYRLAPHHEHPAALEDCVAVYRAVLASHAPGDVVLCGSSAGGNLAVASILRARDLGFPLPAAAVLLSPAVDLTCAGDTWCTNRDVDPVVPLVGLEAPFARYAGGHDLRDPSLSPLFGDFTKGFPPTLLQAGTRDRLLSDVVRLHRALRRAGVEAELHVFEAMPHGGFGGTPEDLEKAAEVRRFVRERLGLPPSGG